MARRAKSCKVTIKHNPKVRTFGGWYQHDEVFVNGKRVGMIQTRRRHKRTETHTAMDGGGGVIGTDLGWLLRGAGCTRWTTKWED